MIARSWLEDDSSPAVPFRQACLPEYRRRLLAVAAAVAGWPRARVAPLWPFVECASRAFEAEAVEPWLAALDEVERRAGITVEAGSEQQPNARGRQVAR